MNRTLEQGNRFASQNFPTSHNQSSTVHNSSNFIPESDKVNFFSFNMNEADFFDLSADIYDIPQTNIFPSDTSFASDQHSIANPNHSFFQPYNEPNLQQEKQNQDSTNVFDHDTNTTLNLLSRSNNFSKNTEFKTLKDFDASPEGYVDYNKNPAIDDILSFERKNLIIKNHQPKLKDDEKDEQVSEFLNNFNENSKFPMKEKTTRNKSLHDLFDNGFFTDIPESVFEDHQIQQKQNQTQSISQSLPHNFHQRDNFYSQNQSLFKENHQPQLALKLSDQPQMQSTPQFNNFNSLFSSQNLQFPSPSSANDLYQYCSNGNSLLQPPVQYQNQFPMPNQNQRSSTAPIQAPIVINNSMTSSTSTIPIDFSMGSNTTEDPSTLFAMSTQSFNMAMSNRSLVFQPMALSFEPYEYWLFQERTLSFNDLVCKFFRHNKTNFTKFMYKLYDMLRITTVFPSLRQAVGVYFINDIAISVDKYAMINMLSLNPKNVDGSLFHKQGNFPTHGFIEVTSENYKEAGFTKNPVYKSKSIRILFNKDHKFVNKVMSTAELDAIAYENKSKKMYKRK